VPVPAGVHFDDWLRDDGLGPLHQRGLLAP